MTDAIARVSELWGRAGVRNRGATHDQIATFEQQHGVRLAGVIREYFELLNGTAGGQIGMDDEDQIGFWHLEQLQPVDDYLSRPIPGSAELFVFADWLIDSWGYVVHLNTAGDTLSPVFVTYNPLKQIAGSFEEFLSRYAQHDLDMLFPK